MLKVLLFSRADPEEEYGAIELLQRMGLPFETVKDLNEIDREKGFTVLVIPHSAMMSANEEEIFTSDLPIISIGFVPNQRISENIGFSLNNEKSVQPPSYCGQLEMSNGTKAPFYYSFPIVETLESSLVLMGKIYAQGKEYPGVIGKSHGGNIKVFILANLLRSVTYFLSGAEESVLKSSEFFDEYGRINARKIRGIRKEFMETPVLEVYQEILFKVLQDICKMNDIPLVQKWFYPFKHKIALCLTHDIDIVSSMPFRSALESFLRKKRIKEGIARLLLAFIYQASSFIFKTHLSGRRDTYGMLPQQILQTFLPYNPYWNFDVFDRIEKEFKASNSTYFFQTGVSRKTYEGLFNRIEIDYSIDSTHIRRVIGTLRQKGCEIGLHGSIASYKNTMQMQSEKSKLIEVIGTQHIGVRQHRLLMDIPGTWELHAQEGFIYDSSYGYAHDFGFRAGTGFPFNPWDIDKKRDLPILEIPPIIHDGTFYQEHFLNYSAEKALEICKGIVDVVRRYNGVITVLWHPHIDREKQRQWFDSYSELLRYALEYDPWRTNAMELAKWWILRKKVKFGKIEADKTSVKFSLYSPANYQGFSIKMQAPDGISNCEVSVNGQSLECNRIEKYEDSILFSFDMSEGANEVKIMMNK